MIQGSWCSCIGNVAVESEFRQLRRNVNLKELIATKLPIECKGCAVAVLLNTNTLNHNLQPQSLSLKP